MKKQALLFVLLSSLVLTGCGNRNTSKDDGPKADVDLGEKEFHTELMDRYLADDWKNIKEYIPVVSADNPTGADKDKLLGDVSQPEAIKLEFEAEDAQEYVVQIAKTIDFANAKEINVKEKSYDFYNSEINQQYYYRAAVSKEALAAAKVYTFKVKDEAPRNIKVDGVINFRDCGGWKSSLVENGHVKQGLYYRCAQFDDTNNASKVNITAEGKATIKELGIKVDIDMRDRPRTASPAASEDWPVEVLNGAVASSTENIRWEGKNATGSDTKIAKTYKKIFEAIAEADQKPIALHCTHGADRTGIVSFFLLALCGVSVDDCGRDYSLTRFAGERKVWHEDEFDNWVNKTNAVVVEGKEDATFADKMFEHMNKDFEIEADTLETIREKFVPGYARKAA